MLARKRPRLTRLSVEPLEERRLLSVASFQDGVLPTPDYAGTRDVPLFGAEEGVNFGDTSPLRADAEQGSTGFPIWSLIKWDLSGIPATATISDVSITVNVTNTTVAPGFNLLAMRTDWIESEATWNGPTSTSTWEEPGVTDPSDFNPTVLGTMTGTTTGPLTVILNSAGRAVVAGWLNDPASNHGLLISNPDNDNSLRFDSREGTTPANRPKLSIDFTFDDLDPPTATLIDPLDNGPADQDSDPNEVRVGVRDTFVLQLDDFALDDASVTAEALSITKDAVSFSDFTFSFDSSSEQITLTPTAGIYGEGLYTVTLSGGDAKIADASGNQMPVTTFDITIDGAIPVTVDDAYNAVEDTLLIVDPDAGLLDNDFISDPAANAELVAGPQNGTVTINDDGSFSYQPDENFFGSDTFTYRAVIGQFESNASTVQITIAPVNDRPVAVDDAYVAEVGQPLEIGATYEKLILAAEPLGYWRLNEVSGATTAIDLAGTHNGTYQNFSASGYQQPGALRDDADSSVRFSDGSNSGVVVPHSDDLAIAGDLTMEFWVYKTGEVELWSRLVGKGEFEDRNYGIFEEFRDNKRLLFHQRDSTDRGGILLYSTSTIELNQWYHVAATVSGNSVKLYVDGQLDAEGTLSENIGIDTSPLKFATMTGHDTFTGRLDEIAIYDRALSPGEIAQRYLAGAEGTFAINEGVLANDPDAEGDSLTATLVDDVQNGTLTLAENGSFTYTPDEDFTGIDSFTYTATDGTLTSNVATVTIRVGVEEVPADLTGNGFVDFEDLTVLLAAWNQNVSAAQGNLVDAGTSPVNFEDLTVLLAAWTGPGAAGAPVGRRLAAAVGGDSVGDDGGAGESVAVGDASYRRGDEAPRQAAAYGSATGIASYRERRGALRRLQAVAVDRAMMDEQIVERSERIFARRPTGFGTRAPR